MPTSACWLIPESAPTHLGQPRLAVLAAWGIDASGAKHLLGLLPGTKEDTASCRDFLRDLKARGLADPLLVVTDGDRVRR